MGILLDVCGQRQALGGQDTTMKKYHLASPSATFMVVALLVLSSACIAYGTILTDVADAEDIKCTLIMVSLELLLYLVIILDGHEMTPYYKIENNQLSLYAIGKKTWRINLQDCQDIGIDYGVLSGGIEQYWMYFSKERIPRKYFHNMNRLKYSPTCIKIQFSEEAYQIIYNGSSPDVQRKLKNAHSVIDNLRRKGNDDW